MCTNRLRIAATSQLHLDCFPAFIFRFVTDYTEQVSDYCWLHASLMNATICRKHDLNTGAIQASFGLWAFSSSTSSSSSCVASAISPFTRDRTEQRWTEQNPL